MFNSVIGKEFQLYDDDDDDDYDYDEGIFFFSLLLLFGGKKIYVHFFFFFSFRLVQIWTKNEEHRKIVILISNEYNLLEIKGKKKKRKRNEMEKIAPLSLIHMRIYMMLCIHIHCMLSYTVHY